MKAVKQGPTNSIQTMRSINVALDIERPERLVGYIPTQKSIYLTNEIFSAAYGTTLSRAFAVAAPYGSGKSSAGLLWCLLAENSYRNTPEIKSVIEAVKKQNNDENSVIKFIKQKRQLLAVPVDGYEDGVTHTLISGINKSLKRAGRIDLLDEIKPFKKTVSDLFKILNLLKSELSSTHSGVLFVWDEFGKLLESAAAASDTKALFEIQTIAEYASRSDGQFPIVFTILLHQSFARYASNLPAYVRTEWAKIEGRFKQINYIEDSKEIYQLISQVIARGVGKPESSKKVFDSMAVRCHEIGIFREFDTSSLSEILWSAAPLSPISLYLLPRISARVAQNERTLFSFLCSDEPNALKSINREWITPSDIYDFFSDLMRVDTAIGGSHRQWVETNIALNKVETHAHKELIRDLSCMKIASSQSNLVPNEVSLALARGKIATSDCSEIQSNLKVLLKDKIVFYRRINNEYSVWQGSDVDIRSAVAELKSKFEELIDVKEFLESEYPPPFRYPQRHNDNNSIRRYYSGYYCTATDLKKMTSWDYEDSSDIGDGKILYVLAETKDEIRNAKKYAEELKNDLVVVAIPKNPLAIRDAVIELKAYHELLADPEFCGQDPVVDQEIRQLADECETYLRSQIDRLLTPASDGPIFVYKGTFNDEINSSGSLKRFLSEIADIVFSQTPTFNNELINKSDPSAQIVNARKKLVRAILENYGKENLGLEGYGPEVSIFRAVFLQTTLYRQVPSGEWKFIEPRYIKNESLKQVWSLFYDFWHKPSEFDKDPELLWETINKPPFGLREGLYPLLTAAAYVTSNATINIMDAGIYVSDIKAETFEKMLKNPSALKIMIPPINDDFKQYLDHLIEIFSPGQSRKGQDPIRLATATLMRWAKSLPQVALERGMASTDADNFINLIKNAKDPTQLHSTDLLEVANVSNFSDLIQWVKKVKQQIEDIEPQLLAKVKASIIATLGAAESQDLKKVLQSWKAALPGRTESYQSDPIMAGFLTRVDTKYESEEDLIRSMAEQFTGRVLRFWDHRTLALFDLKLHQTIKLIEDLADSIDLEAISTGNGQSFSLSWTERRLTTQLKAISEKLGEKPTKMLIKRILERIEV